VNSDQLHQLLSKIERREIGVDEVADQILGSSVALTAATADARVDLDRRRRCGYSEVVFCEGKTPEAIVEIFEALSAHKQDCFGTRISPEQAKVVTNQLPAAQHNSLARTIRLSASEPGAKTGEVVVITAGTSDRPVAEEAVETIDWMGSSVDLIVDVGVAGPHRLREQLSRLETADAVVVVAGMEGALPSVVGGYVDCPVIAVPTSVGYGASFGGLAALLGMLNSCASNVAVVNIDGGFKAGYLAGLIARRSGARE
jgi:hypothetical protein